MGRSNVGKSSLINLLTKKSLAKTSKTPGRTKSLVFFFNLKNYLELLTFQVMVFHIFPKKKIIKLDNLIEGYLSKRANIKKIFLLFDARHLIKPIDKIIIDSLLEIQRKEVNFIFTKIDKIKSLDKKNLVKKWKTFLESSTKKSFILVLKKVMG